jgi:Co/Zn/Cd efflux system component
MGFVDPTAAVIQILIIACLSYSYGKRISSEALQLSSWNILRTEFSTHLARDAGYILLLTIPGDIDVKMFANELHENFPQIYDIHEFHIWQLTPTRIVASAHLVLHNSESSWSVQQSVASYLKSKGVTHVTLQPEFIEVLALLLHFTSSIFTP